MIEIDGSHGGGQLIRSSLSLSAITQKPFKIINIRGKRNNPGLSYQHLAALNSMKKLCNAKVKGNELRSQEVTFIPNKITLDKLDIDIKTAGSTTLLLQTLIPACLFKKTSTEIEVLGGTDTHWALPSIYFKDIFSYFLEKMDVHLDFEIKKFGFYPKGQGDVVLKINPCKKIKSLEIKDRGKLEKIKVSCYASQDLKNKKIAEKILESFKENFVEEFESEVNYVNTASSSAFVHATAYYENTRLGHTAILWENEEPRTAGERCAKTLLEEINSDALLDRFAADQMMIYIALAGSGRYTTSKIRDHILTNAAVIEKFLDVKFSIENNEISCQKA
jgi:RNA 3'-terminal phosphate cyclase (ATP)